MKMSTRQLWSWVVGHRVWQLFHSLMVGALVIASALLLSCGKKSQYSSTEKPLEKVSVRLTWLHQASYVPFHVAKEKGFYAREGLDVQVLPSGPDLRPVTPVIAGEDEFGVEGASTLIAAAANDLPIEVVGTYLQRSPEVFMSRKSDNLSSMSSWKGKKVGIWIGTHVEPLFYAMLEKAGMRKSDVEIVPARFDIAPFLADGADRVPIWNAYIYNEAQIPLEKGIELNILAPETLGIERAGEGIFVSKAYAAKHPDIIRKFLRATAEGIRYARAHQEEAIAILTSGKYGKDFDIAHQKRMLAAAAPLMFSNGGEPLVTDIELWKKTIATSFIDKPAKLPKIEEFVTDQYLK